MYQPIYAEAYRSLKLRALNRLGITHLYLIPTQLDAVQRRGLNTAVASGGAERVDAAGSGEAERVVYALAESSARD